MYCTDVPEVQQSEMIHEDDVIGVLNGVSYWLLARSQWLLITIQNAYPNFKVFRQAFLQLKQ